MRVFTFFLMIAVAIGGTLGGYRLITGKDLFDLADLGLRPAAGSSASSAGLTSETPATVVPSPTPAPTLSPPTPTPAPDVPQAMLVGNTDGQGVYLRRTPRIEDRLQAWREGTRMEIIGKTVESEGQKWRKVRAPNGVEGYVPEEYLVNEP